MQTVNNDAGSMNDTNKGAIYDGETFAEAFDAASSVTPAGSLNADVNVDSNAGRGGRFPIGKIAVVLSVVIIIGVLSIVGYRYNEHLEQAYAEAVRELTAGDFDSAEQKFREVPDFRDAESLAVYCHYAAIYENKKEYSGGASELDSLELRYDTEWQQDIDALQVRVLEYQAARDAVMIAEREARLKEEYSGKLPVEGMPMSCLKYTLLGSPDQEEKCSDFYKLREDHRSISVWWYGEDGSVIAAGTLFKFKNDPEFLLYSFHTYDYGDTVSSPKGGNSSGGTAGNGRQASGNGNGNGNGGGKAFGGFREDYDSPDEFWEDNQDWYDDEDEAWDDWYDGDDEFDEEWD